MGDTGGAIPAEAAVAVAGAGTMGRGIAEVAARSGHPVALFDARPGAAVDAVEEIRRRLERDAARGRLGAADARDIARRVTTVDRLDELGAADLVIEAIAEDLDSKRRLFATLDVVADAHTVFATNTSSLSVADIASATSRADRFAGLHFFNPAPRMPLVEVVRAPQSAEATIATITATARAWGKTPVVCTDTPGFIVNRVARPFYLEALSVLETHDVQPERIDAVFRGAGFPMGPCELLDLIGLDVNLAVSESVHSALDREPRIAPSPLQRSMVAAGRLGRKTGRGFYEHPARTPDVAPHPPGGFTTVAVIGDLGHGSGLGERIAAAHDLEGRHDRNAVPGIVIDGITIQPAPGRPGATATFDVVADWSRASIVGASGEDGAMDALAGVCASIGVHVIRMPHNPGGVVLRTVAMLVAMATEAAAAGVAAPDDIDTAIRLGLRHPLGPFEWRTALGAHVVDLTLRLLATSVDPARYRPVAP
jgi:3-hydroxybutyryl-CoA dehydrogenase